MKKIIYFLSLIITYQCFGMNAVRSLGYFAHNSSSKLEDIAYFNREKQYVTLKDDDAIKLIEKMKKPGNPILNIEGRRVAINASSNILKFGEEWMELPQTNEREIRTWEYLPIKWNQETDFIINDSPAEWVLATVQEYILIKDRHGRISPYKLFYSKNSYGNDPAIRHFTDGATQKPLMAVPTNKFISFNSSLDRTAKLAYINGFVIEEDYAGNQEITCIDPTELKKYEKDYLIAKAQPIHDESY